MKLRHGKRIFSLVLVLLMALAMIPSAALAAPFAAVTQNAEDPVVPVRAIAFDQQTYYIEVSDEPTVDASIGMGLNDRSYLTPTNATNQKLYWTSSNPQMPIDENGTLSFKKRSDKTTVTVTTDDGGFTAKCDVLIWVTGTEVVGASFTVGTKEGTQRAYTYRILSCNPNEVAMESSRVDDPYKACDPLVLSETVTSPASGTVYTLVGIGSPGNRPLLQQSYLASSWDLVIPDTIRNIEPWAFYGHTKLISVTFGTGLKKIDARAFCYCSNLERVDFSKCTGLEIIGKDAFGQSIDLTGPIVLPASVKEIGNKAFLSCNTSGYLSIPKTAEIGDGEIYLFRESDEMATSGSIIVDVPDIVRDAGTPNPAASMGFVINKVIRSQHQTYDPPALDKLGVLPDYSAFGESALPGVYDIPLVGPGNTTCPHTDSSYDPTWPIRTREYSIVVRRGTVTINPVPPTIAISPAVQTIDVGGSATVTATVPARDKLALQGKNYTLQWQRFNGSDWVNVGSPETKPNNAEAVVSYTLANATEADSGARFRCKVEDPYGAAASTEATVLVNPVTHSACNLAISKTVAGDGADTTKNFKFVVTFAAQGSYSFTGSKTGTIRSGDSVQLAHGQYIVIENLPVGVSYAVTETEADKNGYTTIFTGATGTTVQGTVTAAFTNTKQTSGGFGRPEKPANPVNPVIPVIPTPPDPPCTGDDLTILFWLSLLAISIAGLLLGALLHGRRKSK